MNIEQLPSGKWRASVRVGGQRRRTEALPTKAAAKMAGAQLMVAMGGTPSAADMTMVELLAAHLDQHAYAPTTAADARLVVERLPHPFMDRQLRDVTPAVLSALYRELGRAGWSPHRVRRAHMVISAAFTRARRYGWVTVNPARDADVPALPDHEIHPPTDAEVALLLDAAPVKLATFLMVAATSGARRGELVALRWGDIDFDAATVVIRRSLAYTKASGLVVTEGKIGRRGHRVIALDAATVGALADLRATEREKAMAAGYRGNGYTFSHDGGFTPWRPDYATHAFVKLRDSLGLTVRLHDARHYVATTMLADGASPAQVAGRLGHANANTTLRVYSHFVPARDREHADRLGERLKRSGTV